MLEGAGKGWKNGRGGGRDGRRRRAAGGGRSAHGVCFDLPFGSIDGGRPRVVWELTMGEVCVEEGVGEVRVVCVVCVVCAGCSGVEEESVVVCMW